MAFTPDDLANLLQLPSMSESSPLRTLNPRKRHSVMMQLFDELDAGNIPYLQIFVVGLPPPVPSNSSDRTRKPTHQKLTPSLACCFSCLPQAEFNSRHLPPFVQQCMVTFASTSDHLLNWQAKMALLATLFVNHRPSVARFVRENAGIARELYVLLAATLGFLMETDAFTNFDRYETFACSLFTLITSLGTNIVSQNLDINHLPILENSTVEDIDGVLPLLRIQQPVANSQGHLQTLSSLDEMIHGRFDVVGIRGVAKDLHGPWVLGKCEIETPTDEHFRDCPRLSKGEEMQACGRCRAVRYCSREHQRLDWKRHKRICFEPNW